MSSFVFTKELHVTAAFTDYMQKNFGDAFYSVDGVPPFDQPLIRVNFNRDLTADEQSRLSTLVADYVSPAYWLVLDHTDNAFLSTPPTNSSDPIVCQSFIISPYNVGSIVMGDVKTIIQYSTPDLSVFADWDPQTTPITCTIEIYSYTQNKSVVVVTTNINDVVSSWLNDNTADPCWRSIQLYGLKDASPGSDEIWQLKLSVSDPRVFISLNSLQRLYYNVIA